MPLIKLNGATVEHATQGASPYLLLLHSLLTDTPVFARVLPALAAHYRVTRVNLPGYGLSMPRVFHIVADYANHFAQVMNALKLPPQTHVFGNAFGAFVALMLAVRHGKRFNKLLVADVLDAAIGRMFPPASQAAHPDG